MEEVTKSTSTEQEQSLSGMLSQYYQLIYATLLLHWKWFLISLIFFVGLAAVYLRYTTPVYQAGARLLVKQESYAKSSSLRNNINLGTISNSEGLENEMELLKSRTLATQAVRDLKLYISYKSVGRVNDLSYYKNQPISVDIDQESLEKISIPIRLIIKRNDKIYEITGTYLDSGSSRKESGLSKINHVIKSLPTSIKTGAGILTFRANTVMQMRDGEEFEVTIQNPKSVGSAYAGGLRVLQLGTTSIATLTITDINGVRAVDFLRQLVICYNRQANEDKNETAVRTEEFINGRLEKINAELSSTEGSLENYKKANKLINSEVNVGQVMNNADSYEKKLAESNTQLALMKSVIEYMNQPVNKYGTLPSNVGLSDQSATSLINKYNDIVLERNRLLRSASETSPTVMTLTAQLDDLTSSIRRAMDQAKHGYDIQRNAIAQQYRKYNNQILRTPEQERMLTQIGRQQDVKSGLYLMLLQKREENSISLAATVDKGKLIDDPVVIAKVYPNNRNVFSMAVAVALILPAVIIFVIMSLRYKIEGRADVERLTKLPIIADVPIASDTAKAKADIVVYENRNTQMEEIFRGIRTNIMFMLAEGEKVVEFTSSISGEGKTFVASNVAVSFALLGKKVILVGLDIRKPRLAELFEIDDHRHGITNLLTHSHVTKEDIKKQVLNSEVNDNLDLLMSGPIPPNPAELLTRKSLDDIFALLKEDYDYIIVDTAPIGLVTDTLHIGRICDATIVMCRADYTPKSSFDYVNQISVEKKLPHMSVIINGIDLSKKKYGYYYGYGKYGKYGSYKKYGYYGYYGSYSKNPYTDKNDTSIKQ